MGSFFSASTLVGPTLVLTCTLLCRKAAAKKLKAFISTKILMSKNFKRKIEQAAPRILDIEKLVSSSAFNTGTFSVSTKIGGSESIAGLKMLEPMPIKKAAANKQMSAP